MDLNNTAGINNTVNSVSNTSNTVQSTNNSHNKTNVNKQSNSVEKLSVTPKGENTSDNIRNHIKEFSKEDVEKQLKELVSEINNRTKSNTAIDFSIHDKTKRINVKIINKDTKEVINEWPSEKSLDILAKLIDKEAIVLDKKL